MAFQDTRSSITSRLAEKLNLNKLILALYLTIAYNSFWLLNELHKLLPLVRLNFLFLEVAASNKLTRKGPGTVCKINVDVSVF